MVEAVLDILVLGDHEAPLVLVPVAAPLIMGHRAPAPIPLLHGVLCPLLRLALHLNVVLTEINDLLLHGFTVAVRSADIVHS